ncbi:hypothetical protein ESCO_006541 [Escovopsis weberi]|uniref:N-acetyltransferase domain-containing protein n=1 Tax=Escovopsis weberi TaxID=150374 RepID=A0A0M8MZ87_ESCWE|nr:hypothetical protein ESCO_006541 [Escovopsis weberi]
MVPVSDLTIIDTSFNETFDSLINLLSVTMATPFIRPYQPSDFEAAAHICRATLPPSMAGVEFAERLSPYIWTHAYTHLSPRTCFVLDDGAGRAVGYVIGCADAGALVAGYAGYRAAVLDVSEEVRRSGTTAADAAPGGTDTEERMLRWVFDQRGLLVAGKEGLRAEGITATMHIDLLAGWQGKGWGKKMVERFVGSVRAEGGAGCRGVWIGIAPDNAGVVGFYERLGFGVRSRGDLEICMVRHF